jgi:hypothetical protein
MITNQNQASAPLTWQALGWRVLLTALLLIALTGFSLTVANPNLSQSNPNVLPSFTYTADLGK